MKIAILNKDIELCILGKCVSGFFCGFPTILSLQKVTLRFWYSRTDFSDVENNAGLGS